MPIICLGTSVLRLKGDLRLYSISIQVAHSSIFFDKFEESEFPHARPEESDKGAPSTCTCLRGRREDRKRSEATWFDNEARDSHLHRMKLPRYFRNSKTLRPLLFLIVEMLGLCLKLRSHWPQIICILLVKSAKSHRPAIYGVCTFEMRTRLETFVKFKIQKRKLKDSRQNWNATLDKTVDNPKNYYYWVARCLGWVILIITYKIF